jgi:hypothetical protein
MHTHIFLRAKFKNVEALNLLLLKSMDSLLGILKQEKLGILASILYLPLL